jgi:hypothetical protein
MINMLATHSLPLETQKYLLCSLKVADASAFKQTLQSADKFNIDIKHYKSQEYIQFDIHWFYINTIQTDLTLLKHF